MRSIHFTALTLAFAVGGALASMSAQQSAPSTAPTRPIASAKAVANDISHSTQGQQDLQHRNPRYKIQREDVLSITFPLSPEFDQPRITVQPDGYINLQEVGSVYVQDLTVPEVVAAVKKAYSGILHDPIIDVDLLDFQRPYFVVSGQVGKPGQYELRHDTTVSEAIGIAGGFAPTAKTQVFLYHRVSQDWMEVKKLSVKDILNGKHVNEDAYLAPGDMIFVPEKFITKFRKYVPYGVGTSVGTAFY
jgi:polysaccharide export outer membrane protein